MTGGTAVVVGFGATGRAVTAHLVARGWRVVVVDDAADGAAGAAAGGAGDDATAREVAAAGATLRAVDVVPSADLVVPSPGVPPRHPVHALAARAGVPVVSEVELAWRAAGGRPMVAVTGTNGKTTVTTLVAAMLVESGRSAIAAGNIGLPLVTAVDTAVDSGVEVVVAEVSSFQLQHTDRFRPDVAVWLNLAPDHLDWHPDLASYAAAKARVWANQGPDDVAVANAEDAVVAGAAGRAPGRVVTFGLESGDWRRVGDTLCGPGGAVMPVDELPRAFPHDVANVLAAMAAATA
ncbi:MAG: UDP-N-acetylmuramoyl-L-alanine--D-glutamate ligase, partial [Actinomycetota bacterium]|nr:UDP-N-acetylmuramoyl-L-alanine--D-glutamate ligase [Actinomycetota bacterium]